MSRSITTEETTTDLSGRFLVGLLGLSGAVGVTCLLGLLIAWLAGWSRAFPHVIQPLEYALFASAAVFLCTSLVRRWRASGHSS